MDNSLQAPLFIEILQARIVEQVAISFSRGSSDSGTEPMSPALADGFFTQSGGEVWVKEEEAHSCSRKGKHQFFLEVWSPTHIITSLGNLIEMQVWGPYPRPAGSSRAGD